MPRYPRNYSKTCFFHIMTQGINKRYIFQNEEDIKYYINLIYLLKDEHNIKIHAYCIMSNHAHILLETKELKEMSKYMQRLNTRFGKYYNKKYNRIGYVFRDRFKSEGIYNEKQFYNCIKYIYDNPVKAGICKRPEEYAYSNYKKVETYDEEINSFIDIDEDIEDNYKIIINNFLEERNLKIDDLKNDNNILGNLIEILYKKSFSLREIAEKIGVKREKVRRIYNKWVNKNRPH